MSVATLTRESVQAAISNGITAEQILHYLRAHAHPEMRTKVKLKNSRFLIFKHFVCFTHNVAIAGYTLIKKLEDQMKISEFFKNNFKIMSLASVLFPPLSMWVIADILNEWILSTD